MVFILISIFLLIPYSALILYYRKSWMSINEYVPSKIFTENELPFISVIIAARNEEKNIGNCIQSIIRQSYPANKFEIIVTTITQQMKLFQSFMLFKKKISGSLILLILLKIKS